MPANNSAWRDCDRFSDCDGNVLPLWLSAVRNFGKMEMICDTAAQRAYKCPLQMTAETTKRQYNIESGITAMCETAKSRPRELYRADNTRYNYDYRNVNSIRILKSVPLHIVGWNMNLSNHITLCWPSLNVPLNLTTVPNVSGLLRLGRTSLTHSHTLRKVFEASLFELVRYTWALYAAIPIWKLSGAK